MSFDKISGKLQSPNPGRMTEMKVWVILPGKDPRPAEELAEGGGKAE